MSQRTECRSCRSADLAEILDLGRSPLADRLLKKEELGREDPAFPLQVALCNECSLVQTTFDVPGDAYSDDYPYYTSRIPALVEHFDRAVDAILERRPLLDGDAVIEVASNDGHQLLSFLDRGRRSGLSVEVLGVDPARGPAAEAVSKGVPTEAEFFTHQWAQDHVAKGRKQVSYLVGNNALNLLPDVEDFRRAVDLLLAEDGILVLEVPSFVRTLELGAFDNVFHQNVTYWTLHSFAAALAPIGVVPFDVEAIPTFGGSLRLYASRQPREETPSWRGLWAEEERMAVESTTCYAPFADRARRAKQELESLLTDLRSRGKRIVAYGAAGGMATTLLSFLEVPAETFAYAVDRSEVKHGRYTPGHQLLIRSPLDMLEDQPDFALLLAWNFEDAIVAENRAWIEAGGRFLIPVPEVRIRGLDRDGATPNRD